MTNKLSSLSIALASLGFTKEASIIKLAWGSEQEWRNAFKAILSGKDKAIGPTKVAMDQHDLAGTSERYKAVLNTFGENDKKKIHAKLSGYKPSSEKDSVDKEDNWNDDWEWMEYSWRNKMYQSVENEPLDEWQSDSFEEANSDVAANFGLLTLDKALVSLNLSNEILSKLNHDLLTQLKQVIAATEAWGKHLDIITNFNYHERIERLKKMLSASGAQSGRRQIGSEKLTAIFDFDSLNEMIGVFKDDFKNNPEVGYDFLFTELKRMFYLNDVALPDSGNVPYWIFSCCDYGAWQSYPKLTKLILQLVKSGKRDFDFRGERNFTNLSPEMQQVIIENGTDQHVAQLATYCKTLTDDIASSLIKTNIRDLLFNYNLSKSVINSIAPIILDLGLPTTADLDAAGQESLGRRRARIFFFNRIDSLSPENIAKFKAAGIALKPE